MAISVRSQTKYVVLPSKRFLCAKCLRYMEEHTPVIETTSQMANFRRYVVEDLKGETPHVWLRCPNGCPFGVHGFRDVLDRTLRVSRTQPGKARPRIARR